MFPANGKSTMRKRSTSGPQVTTMSALVPTTACQAVLDAYCRANCDAHLGVATVALKGAGRQPGLAWRCYAHAALTADGTSYAAGGSSQYCTRHEALSSIFDRCDAESQTESSCSASPPDAVENTTSEAVDHDAPQLLTRPHAITRDHPWHTSYPHSRVLSLRPLVVEVPHFLSADECDGLVRATSRQQDESRHDRDCSECGEESARQSARAWAPSPDAYTYT